MYAKQTAYDSIPDEHRSLLTAYSNLVSFLGLQPIAPDVLYRSITSDDPVIDHEVLPEYVKGISLDEVNDNTTSWPNENGTIIKVRRYDEAKMHYVDHYLVLIDTSQRAVIDSYDGIIKHGESYGELNGWVRYSRQPERDTQADQDNVMYTVQAGENLWDVARKLNMKFDELKDYNTIDDPRTVREGYVLHLPIRDVVDNSTIRYELLETPENMHVSRVEGARKLMFGNADTFADIAETGRTHAENSNHTIYAIAYVDLSDSDAPAAYYMDRLDVGEMALTGRPRFTTGFNHSHMSQGHVLVGQPVEISSELVERLEEVKEQLVQATEVVESVETAPVDNVENDEPRTWKDDMTFINDNEEPTIYVAKEDFDVYDIEGVNPPRRMVTKGKISLTYEVSINGDLYGLPRSYVEKDIYYLFPIRKLRPEEDELLYNVSMYDKILLRRSGMGSQLSMSERSVVLISKILAYGVKIKQLIRKKIK